MGTDYNPFTEISTKLDKVLTRIEALETKGTSKPTRISLPEFCRQQGISRPTIYSWADRGLVQMEKIGGRQFIKTDSIIVTKKFERQIK